MRASVSVCWVCIFACMLELLRCWACVSSLFLWHNGLCKIIPKRHNNTSGPGDCEAAGSELQLWLENQWNLDLLANDINRCRGRPHFVISSGFNHCALTSSATLSVPSYSPLSWWCENSFIFCWIFIYLFSYFWEIDLAGFDQSVIKCKIIDWFIAFLLIL